MKLDSKTLIVGFLFVIIFIIVESCLESCQSQSTYTNCKMSCEEPGILLVDINTCICKDSDKK